MERWSKYIIIGKVMFIVFYILGILSLLRVIDIHSNTCFGISSISLIGVAVLTALKIPKSLFIN